MKFISVQVLSSRQQMKPKALKPKALFYGMIANELAELIGRSRGANAFITLSVVLLPTYCCRAAGA